MTAERDAAVRPDPGTVWAWEPAKPHAAELVMVTGAVWNGEEWLIASLPVRMVGTVRPAGRVAWNDLGRWWEAAHAISALAGHATSAGVHTGPPTEREATQQARRHG